jgi:hypothetical protein
MAPRELFAASWAKTQGCKPSGKLSRIARVGTSEDDDRSSEFADQEYYRRPPHDGCVRITIVEARLFPQGVCVGYSGN